jgi:hypothetical protein
MHFIAMISAAAVSNEIIQYNTHVYSSVSHSSDRTPVKKMNTTSFFFCKSFNNCFQTVKGQRNETDHIKAYMHNRCGMKSNLLKRFLLHSATD